MRSWVADSGPRLVATAKPIPGRAMQCGQNDHRADRRHHQQLEYESHEFIKRNTGCDGPKEQEKQDTGAE